MNKVSFVALALSLALVSCAPANKHNYHKKEQKVYHFADGRVGYHDDSMIWYFLILNQQQTNMLAASAASSSSPVYIQGSWSKGPPPSAKELSEAEEEEVTIDESVDGEPTMTPEEVTEATESEAESAETATESTPTESVSEAPSGGTGEATSGGEASSGGDGGSGGGDGGGGGSSD